MSCDPGLDRRKFGALRPSGARGIGDGKGQPLIDDYFSEVAEIAARIDRDKIAEIVAGLVRLREVARAHGSGGVERG